MNGNQKKIFEHPDGGYGWIIVTAGIIINSSLNPLVQCFGVIFENEFQFMNITAAQTAFLLHLQYSMMCITSLLSSPFLKKYTFKRISFIGSCLMCLGIFLTSYATGYRSLIFTVSILIGVGQGILTPALYIATNSYFKKRLTLAVCYSVTGSSLGPIFMPQVCNFLLNLYGVKGTVFILSAISLNAFAGCLLLRPIKRKLSQNNKNTTKEVSEKLLQTSEEIYKETTIPKKQKKNTFLIKLCDLFNLELLKDRPYVIAVIVVGVSSAAELNTILMVPFALVELSKFDRIEVGNFMSILSTADVTGRLVLPLLAHKSGISPKITYGLSLFGAIIGKTVLAIFCDIRTIVLVSAVLMGLSKGAKAVFQSILIPKYVALEKLAPATGLLMVFNGILSLTIGPILGFVHDLTNTYAYVFHSASIISLACITLWILESLGKRRKQSKQPAEEMPPIPL